MPAIPPLYPRLAPRPLAPAPLALNPPPHQPRGKTSFTDLPAELRVEIFKYVIADVHTCIVPVWSGTQPHNPYPVPGTKKLKTSPSPSSSYTDLPADGDDSTDSFDDTARLLPPHVAQQGQDPGHQRPPISNIHALLSPTRPLDLGNYYASTSTSHATEPPTTTTIYHPRPRTVPKPHSLALVCRQTRNEALPLIHELCPIHAKVVDFDFSPLLAFLQRIPPDDQHKLLKNPVLEIELITTVKDGLGGLDSLRRWLHLRADECRPQARWRYIGERPGKRVVNDLRRRVRRMKEVGKRHEFERILLGLGIDVEVEG